MTFRIKPRARPTIDTGQGLTEQHHKASVDIHTIMRKFKEQGIFEHTSQHAGTYGDYLNCPDFQQAAQHIAEAESMFESVPAEIRLQFDNHPGKFVSFMTDPDNVEAIQGMGFNADHLIPTEQQHPNPAQTPEPTPEAPPPASGETCDD